MLQLSTEGFQLSWASVNPEVSSRAASLFFSPCDTTVCNKLGESKNVFIESLIKMLLQLFRSARICDGPESLSSRQSPASVLRQSYRSAAKYERPRRAGNQQ